MVIHIFNCRSIDRRNFSKEEEKLTNENERCHNACRATTFFPMSSPCWERLKIKRIFQSCSRNLNPIEEATDQPEATFISRYNKDQKLLLQPKIAVKKNQQYSLSSIVKCSSALFHLDSDIHKIICNCWKYSIQKYIYGTRKIQRNKENMSRMSVK